MNRIAKTFWTSMTYGHIAYQQCPTCNHVQFFPASMCSECGETALAWHYAAGNGTVYAKTMVYKAPTPELDINVPYAIILVDMDENFRLMAHARPDVEIGQRVTAEYKSFNGRIIPIFRKL